MLSEGCLLSAAIVPVMYCLVDYFNSVIMTISISVLSSPLFYSRRLPSAVTWAIVIRIGAILQ